VSGAEVNAALKVAAVDVGTSAAHISTHSLRRGGSNAINYAKLGDAFRQEFCAWRSETHQLYKDPTPEACAGVTQRMWDAEDQSHGLRR